MEKSIGRSCEALLGVGNRVILQAPKAMKLPMETIQRGVFGKREFALSKLGVDFPQAFGNS